MTIQIAGYTFEGPYQHFDYLNNDSGVYVILGLNNGGYNYIDCGEAEKVKERVESHDRTKCWLAHCKNGYAYAVLYTSKREKIEQDIRACINFPCGQK